jgi:transitional endoplasmic reticulum ATPase
MKIVYVIFNENITVEKRIGMKNMVQLKCKADFDIEQNMIGVNIVDAIDIDIQTGTPVIIRGKNKTVAQIKIVDEVAQGQAAMNSTMRLNAGISDGEEVEIEFLPSQPIEKVRLQPLIQGIDEITLRQAFQSLNDVYVCKNSRLVGVVNGDPVEFCVTRCKPAHGWLTESTEVELSTKAYMKLNNNIPTVSFSDIGGLDQTIDEIIEIAIVPLLHPEIYQRAGQDPPKGILLYGPPGVGKTLLAKALAREAQCNFVSINGPELFSAAYGESEKMLKEIFQKAKKEAPTVIFIDEIDAIANSRKVGSGQLEKRILTQLLTELDGFEDRGQVLVVGSTNTMDQIDEALLRAGRFDRRIQVPFPNIEGRLHILAIHTSSMPLAADFSIEKWAEKTAGYTGADLANLCRHATVHAITRTFGKERIAKPEPCSEEELKQLEIVDLDFSESMEKSMPYQVSLRRPTNLGFHNIDDIIGHSEAKDELKEHLILPILYKEKYQAMGLNCNGGVILYGPPGTGKTMLGKAVASLSQVQFMAVSGPELLSKWVGESERAVRELFQRAQEAAPVVIFFDEFDALGRQRDGAESSHHSSSVVAQLLSMMDGLNDNEDIYLMASTNEIELVDKAFLRPGRFERSIYVGPLDKSQYLEFFSKEIENVAHNIDRHEFDKFIKKLVDEATGADLFGLSKSAKRNAVARAIKTDSETMLTINDFDTALKNSPHLFSGFVVNHNEILEWDDNEDF